MFRLADALVHAAAASVVQLSFVLIPVGLYLVHWRLEAALERTKASRTHRVRARRHPCVDPVCCGASGFRGTEAAAALRGRFRPLCPWRPGGAAAGGAGHGGPDKGVGRKDPGEGLYHGGRAGSVRSRKPPPGGAKVLPPSPLQDSANVPGATRPLPRAFTEPLPPKAASGPAQASRAVAPIRARGNEMPGVGQVAPMGPTESLGCVTSPLTACRPCSHPSMAAGPPTPRRSLVSRLESEMLKLEKLVMGKSPAAHDDPFAPGADTTQRLSQRLADLDSRRVLLPSPAALGRRPLAPALYTWHHTALVQKPMPCLAG